MAILNIEDYRKEKAKRIRCILHHWRFIEQTREAGYFTDHGIPVRFDYNHFSCKGCGANKRSMSWFTGHYIG